MWPCLILSEKGQNALMEQKQVGSLRILELAPMFGWYLKLLREGEESASEATHVLAGEQGDMSGIRMLYLLRENYSNLPFSLLDCLRE